MQKNKAESKGLFKAPLRRQLIFMVTIIVVLSTASFAFFNVRLQHNILVQEYTNSTKVFLEAVKLGLEIGLKENNYESINTVLAWGLQNETVSFIVLTEESGAILASYPTENEISVEQILSMPTEIDVAKPVFVKTSAWSSQLSGKSMIYVGFKTEYLKALEEKALYNLITIIVFVLMGSYISSYLLAQNIIRPLEELKTVTQQIAENELEQRANDLVGSQEVRVVAASFNSMVDQLLDSQKLRVDEMQSFSNSLEERNSKLTEAYETLEIQRDEIKLEKERTEHALQDLKNAQMQLIQSEKMASLGNLIAGIAHEINTPAGAIKSAINEVEKDYIVLLQQLVLIIGGLSPELRSDYLATCMQIMDFEKDISTKEQREVAKEIQALLDEQSIENARHYSKQLAQIGFSSKIISGKIDLFKQESREEIVNSFHQLGMSQIQVRDIKIAISRISQLVKALKSYSHVDNEVLTETSLVEDFENTLIILNNKLKRAITIKKEFDELPLLRCFPEKLNQVWTNLLHNSIQALKGEGEITIRLKNESNTEIRVEIEDNGPGIPPEILPQIFEPYFSTKSKGEGTGLGLSISKDIIQKHKGRIEVESVPGKTCFKIFLPLTA